ncbi:MAG TPA: LysR substrate-binding domain-containing protein [Usitatibacter sp.]|jgi:DNA-binding transcriptional LysR family regulator|nr:LysR substrate-binding domain-containing protein [Usitatibacter sp.]
MRLNARQLDAFRALMLTSSTVRAAESLHISQPAVSRLVRDLQEALGLTLFERRGTRLVPTSEAVALYSEVERSFVGLERIAQAARDLRERRAGVLRIAAMPALCNGVLPRFAGKFLAKHDRIDLGLEGLVSSAVLDRVVNEQCDVGFAAAPIEHAAVAHRKMPAVPYVAVVPSGHRLARRRVLHPRDFAGEPFIALGPTTPSRFRVDDAFSREGVTRTVRVETPLSEIACALVAAGAGLSIVDPFTAEEYSTRGVVVRRFEPALQFQVAALYPAHRAPSPVAREFIEGFAAYLERWRA